MRDYWFHLVLTAQEHTVPENETRSLALPDFMAAQEEHRKEGNDLLLASASSKQIIVAYFGTKLEEDGDSGCKTGVKGIPNLPLPWSLCNLLLTQPVSLGPMGGQDIGFFNFLSYRTFILTIP